METTVKTSKPSSLKASSLPVPRRVTRSANNPLAPRPPGERRRAESCLRNPAGGSCPGSASPAEASGFQTFFSSFFSPRNLLPKILPRASPGDAPGTPKTSKVRHFAKKSRPQDPTFLVFFGRSLFFTLFDSIFGQFSVKNQWKKKEFENARARFFWTWRPLR